MAETYYAQSDSPAPTMTVGQLIERLQAFDKNAPVIFKSPQYGVFGSNTSYSLDAVEAVTLERVEEHYPACTTIDDETGEEYEQEAWTQVWHPWSGVVIG